MIDLKQSGGRARLGFTVLRERRRHYPASASKNRTAYFPLGLTSLGCRISQPPLPICGAVSRLARSKILGRLQDPATGKPIDAAEAEDFMRCPACGGVVDMRELAMVMAHLAPLPHPA